MLKKLTNKMTWFGGVGAFVKWGVVVGVAFLLGLTVFADSYTLSSIGTTSYQHAVQNGGGVTAMSNTYTIDVPAGMAAKVRLEKSGDGFVWKNCETAKFWQEVNGSSRTLLDQTTEFLSTATIRLYMTASPDISWTEIPQVGRMSNGMPIYGHYIYHYYTYYYARMNYQISVSYEKLMPDLIVSSVSLSSAEAAVDETVTLSYAVRNVGREYASVASIVRIYDGDKQICGDQHIPALSAGGTSLQTVTLPRLSAGKHTIKVVVDASNAIAESYEGNNSSSVLLRDYARTPVAVTFETDSGASSRTVTVIAGNLIGTLPVPFRKGYDFVGWWSERAGGYQIDADEKITMERTFYARWVARTSRIVFNHQGGSGTESVVATYDATMPMISVPVRQGHVFEGYWTDTEGRGVQYYASDGQGLRTWKSELPAVVLYAKWTGIGGELAFDFQGGSGGSISAVATLEQKMPAITLPTRTGWTFQGYYSSPNGEGVQYYTSSGAGARIWDQVNESAVTLYAHWLPNRMTYPLSFDNQDGTGASASVEVTFAADLPDVAVPTRPRYVFEGYYSEPDGQGTQYYDAHGKGVKKWDIAAQGFCLYAKWSPAYKVWFDPNGGEGTAYEQYFTEGAWRLAENTFKSNGWEFAGWAVEPDGVPIYPDGCSVNKALLKYEGEPDESVVTLYAKWSKRLTTSLFPDVVFFTGGVNESSLWRVEDGILHSAPASGESWLSMVCESGAEVNCVLSNANFRAMSSELVYAGSADVRNRSVDGTSESLSLTVPDGRRLVTFVCRKTLCRYANKYLPKGLGEDERALMEFYAAERETLEEYERDIGKEIAAACGYNCDMWIHQSIMEMRAGLIPNDLYDDILRTIEARTGDYLWTIRSTEEWGQAPGTIIRGMCATAEIHAINIKEVEEYLGSIGVIADLSVKPMRRVGFVLDGGDQYGGAVEAYETVAWKKDDLYNVVVPKLVDFTRLELEKNVYSWSSSDDSKLRSAVDSMINDLICHRDRSKVKDILVSWLAAKGLDVTALKWALSEHRDNGPEILGLCSRVESTVSEIETAEGQIADCGVLEMRQLVQGSSIGNLPEPKAEDGYEFAGWWTAAEGGEPVTEMTEVKENLAVYAHWTKTTFSLSFDSGTEQRFEVRTLAYDERIGELPKPVREGCVFGGWIYERSGKAVSILDFLSADEMLVAQWTRSTDWQGAGGTEESGWMLSVTFDANGGTPDMTSFGRNSGDRVGTMPIPMRTGYQFVGWFTAKAGGDRVSETTVVREDVTYYAHWTANMYTIRFMANGGTGAMADQTLTCDVAQMLSANRFKYEEKHFVGWATREHGAVMYRNKATVKNLTAEQGGLVYLYAVWEDGSEGLFPSDPVGMIGSNENAPYASVATTYDGYLYDGGNIVGSV